MKDIDCPNQNDHKVLSNVCPGLILAARHDAISPRTGFLITMIKLPSISTPRVEKNRDKARRFS